MNNIDATKCVSKKQLNNQDTCINHCPVTTEMLYSNCIKQDTTDLPRWSKKYRSHLYRDKANIVFNHFFLI